MGSCARPSAHRLCEAWAGLGAGADSDLDVDDVADFLDDLVKLRLAYEENGRYLALALPDAARITP